jgi:long-chain acyl-CoA synthetase
MASHRFILEPPSITVDDAYIPGFGGRQALAVANDPPRYDRTLLTMTRIAHFFEQLRSHSQRMCLADGVKSLTFVELLDETERWEARLDELSVASGDVIGLRADYSFSAVAVLLALMSRRCVVALIPQLADADRYLADACAAACIDLNVDGTYQWSSVPYTQNHPLLERLRAAGEGGVVIFTSGTTGRPKAALHSVERFLRKFLLPGRRFRTLAFLLFDHVAGLDTLFYTLANGGTVVLTRHRDPRSILQIVQSHAVEVLPCSPSFLRLLCSVSYEGMYDTSSLRIITYGSEPMDPDTLARLNHRFPNVQITQKYGTTEFGSPRVVSRASDSLWVKFKADDVAIKVMDGLLWIRAQAAMLGYLNAPASIDHQGWYCTGDVVDVDGEWIRFRGRASDTINVGGEKVAPIEVEQVIFQLDFVSNVIVTGEPHLLMGHIVTAQVVLTATAPAPKEALQRIRSHCRRQLASYKVPIRVEIASDALTNDRQKTRRR